MKKWPLWLVIEALAGLAVMAACAIAPLYRLFSWRRRREEQGPHRLPVLLVHGWGMWSGSMAAVAWRLARAGFRPVSVGYSWLLSPQRAADRIARRAGEVAARAGVASVDVVAHSLGGLMARAARAGGAGGSSAIGRIVSLGTPHRGEWWSKLPIGPMALSMKPGAFGAAAAGDLAITSRFDLIIRWQRATLDPPCATIILDGGTGHAGLLLDGRAMRATVEHLCAPAMTRRLAA